MRASKEHMKKVRGHILESSEQGFREEGYSGLGINGLAKRAGMTSGAFYGHFQSKNQAFHEVVKKGMNDYIDTLTQLEQQYQDDWPQQFLDFYLSLEHMDDLEHSCVVPALSTDVMRSDEKTKKLFSEQLEQIVAQMSTGLVSRDRTSALALVSLLAGSVMIARCSSSRKQSKEILESARTLANSLVFKEK
ncbi:TetR/AcrR family transcriptional regulator [Litorilituus sediminis]|uniref:TetR/AcrR family transcriptional regulator n=1 Tax=Litorilituus sediminis TaxID=718192 RepID=A0A4P6PA54_9GAMM|nr:TetR/AcrR family transcriptional regulator [Litorilituus sediminis]QBG36492.1 TetR/AcrR family transcriptional regulator [Litorilituus sediminis]